MLQENANACDLIEGRAALVVIDIRESTFVPKEDGERAIPHMPDYESRMTRCRSVIDKARECEIPVIFVQYIEEIKRADLIEFGRELDERLGVQPEDYRIQKRRYSAFFGTDFEILLRGLKVNTLIFVGGLTDVCIHYTFVDGHQSDYHCCVIEDCVAGSGTQAHTASLNAMEYLQAGAVRNSGEVMEAMQHTGSSLR